MPELYINLYTEGRADARQTAHLARQLARRLAGISEIRIQIAGAHRVFYVTTRREAVYILHAFEKKTRKTSTHDLRIGRDRFRAIEKLEQQHGKEKRG
jgi:phage-related protein